MYAYRERRLTWLQGLSAPEVQSGNTKNPGKREEEVAERSPFSFPPPPKRSKVDDVDVKAEDQSEKSTRDEENALETGNDCNETESYQDDDDEEEGLDEKRKAEIHELETTLLRKRIKNEDMDMTLLKKRIVKEELEIIKLRKELTSKEKA